MEYNIEEIKRKLKKYGQEHLLNFYDKLDEKKQNELLETQNKISEAMLAKIQYKVELKVDINKDEQDLLDYLSEKYDEVIEKQGVIMNNLIRESELAQDNIKALEQSRYELELAFPIKHTFVLLGTNSGNRSILSRILVAIDKLDFDSNSFFKYAWLEKTVFEKINKQRTVQIVLIKTLYFLSETINSLLLALMIINKGTSNAIVYEYFIKSCINPFEST